MACAEASGGTRVIPATAYTGAAVIAAGRPLGVVRDLVLNADEGALAFRLHREPGGAHADSAERVVAFDAALHSSPTSVTLLDAQDVVLAPQLPRVLRCLQGTPVIGRPVRLATGEPLACVLDVLICAESGEVLAYVVGPTGQVAERRAPFLLSRNATTAGRTDLWVHRPVEPSPGDVSGTGGHAWLSGAV